MKLWSYGAVEVWSGRPRPLPLTLNFVSTLPWSCCRGPKDLVIPKPAAGGRGTCCPPPAPQPT